MERLCNSVISNVMSEVCNALESDNKPETNGCDNLEIFFFYLALDQTLFRPGVSFFFFFSSYLLKIFIYSFVYFENFIHRS